MNNENRFYVWGMVILPYHSCLSPFLLKISKYLAVTLVLAISMVIAGCGKSPTPSGAGMTDGVSKTALWQDTKEVKVEHVLTIGQDDFEENENYYFALIRDIQLDKDGNLYVLDLKAMRVSKYSPDGIFMHSFKLTRGKGPGEFSYPMILAIDNEDNVYIRNKHERVIVFDNKGKLLKTVKTGIIGTLGFMTVGLDKSIYLTKGRTPHSKRIFKINPEGGIDKTFCTVSDERLLPILEKIDGWEHLAVAHDGTIYYSAIYPYDIRQFSPEGKLLNRFSRDAGFKEPFKIILHGFELTKAGSASIGIAFLPGGKIMNIIRHREKIDTDKYDQEYWFDVFSKDGKWLLSFPSDLFKIKWIRFFAIDPHGYMYLDYLEPYNHVKKFKIEFVDKK